MSGEMKIYSVGPLWPNAVENISETDYDYCTLNKDGVFPFRKSTSKNMDKLCYHFYLNETYPEFYLGIAKRIAICKCPITEKEMWFNADRCFNVDNPLTGSIITVETKINDALYKRDFIFMGWVKTPVHEWRMKKGTILMLEQKFIDGLLPMDKRYLKIVR